jgi:hypothetical protein
MFVKMLDDPGGGLLDILRGSDSCGMLAVLAVHAERSHEDRPPHPAIPV